MAVRERLERGSQQFGVTHGIALVGEFTQRVSGFIQQPVVKLATFRRQAAPRCSISPKRAEWLPDSFADWPINVMGSSSALKLVWRSRIGQLRRGGPSTTALGVMPFGHAFLHRVDVQRTRGQVIDVRTMKRHNVCDQTVLSVQFFVLIQTHRSGAVPAKSFQRLLDEVLCIGFSQAAVQFRFFNQLKGRAG